jgi:hypothetical protein
LNVHRVNDVRQTEMHTAEPLVPDSSLFEVKITIAKLKKYKLPDSDQIRTELIKHEMKHGLRSMNSLIPVRIAGFVGFFHTFGNWIRFHPQVRGETPIQLDFLEKGNLNCCHCHSMESTPNNTIRYSATSVEGMKLHINQETTINKTPICKSLLI